MRWDEMRRLGYWLGMVVILWIFAFALALHCVALRYVNTDT
jgi:hypothetical protein